MRFATNVLSNNATISTSLPGVPGNISISLTATNASNTAEFVCLERLTGPVVVEPAAVVPISSPLNLSAVPADAVSAVVNWSALDPSTWGSSSVGYRLSYSRVANQPQAGNPGVASGGSVTLHTSNALNVSSWQLMLPQPNTLYDVHIAAYNTAGLGPSSAGIRVMTAEDGLMT